MADPRRRRWQAIVVVGLMLAAARPISAVQVPSQLRAVRHEIRSRSCAVLGWTLATILARASGEA